MQFLTNLDCEARWAHRPLPKPVLQRLASLSLLTQALSNDDQVELLTFAPVATTACVPLPGMPRIQVTPAPTTRLPVGTAAWAGDRRLRRGNQLVGIPTASRPPLNHHVHAADHAAVTALQAALHAWALPTLPCTVHPRTAVPHLLTAALAQTTDETCARAANDRRVALCARTTAGTALPGEQAVCATTLTTTLAAWPSATAWVLKAPFTAAGRDRVWGLGPDLAAIAQAQKLLVHHRDAVLEPWVARVSDFGICGVLSPQAIDVLPPHQLHSTERGGFTGVTLTAPAMTALQYQAIARTLVAGLAALHRQGYRGPFAADGFLWHTPMATTRNATDADADAQATLCEINARFSFGWVAHGAFARTGLRHLGLGRQAPADAQLWLQPTDVAPVAAWLGA